MPSSTDPVPAREDTPADILADAVLAVPGVHDLHGGLFGEVGTYLPGRRVRGVRLTEGGCEVHIVAAAGQPLPDVVRGVRAALRPLVGGAVDVTVEDVAR